MVPLGDADFSQQKYYILFTTHKHDKVIFGFYRFKRQLAWDFAKPKNTILEMVKK